jgi:exodeoxyribonuclease VII large subunit
MNLFDTPKDVEILSISALTAQLKGLLEDHYSSVWVEGEISNLARPNSGHLYLTLKDANSQLRSVIYRGIALRLKFEPKDGMEVIARGRITIYQPRGEYQLLIEELEPKGIGALELAFRQLKEKLFLRGYFDPSRKKRLPSFPKQIALVTSPTGAAIRDMLEMLNSRWPMTDVLVCPVRVQGETAAQEIASMIRFLNRCQQEGSLKLDALIVGRGGGSLEDLWAFNEEVVADAIFASDIPVISAVGHEIDLTISDLVADYRALTPTQAASAITPDQKEITQGLSDLAKRLQEALSRQIEFARQKLEHFASHRAFQMPLERIRDQERKLDDLSDRFKRAITLRFERAKDRLVATASQLENLSPLNILSRGYTLTFEEKSYTLLRKVNEVQLGARIVTQLASGTIVSRIEEISETKD